MQIKPYYSEILTDHNPHPSHKHMLPDANFVLAKVSDAQGIYDYLVKRGIIVRNRTRVQLCHNCLRITIGTRNENNELIGAWRQMRVES